MSILKINPFKTLIFNFHYFKFKDAIHAPIMIGWHVKTIKMKGEIVLNCKTRRGLINIGYQLLGTRHPASSPTTWEVDGKIIVNGHCEIGGGSHISVGGTLTIGDNLTITGNSSIICKNDIAIGSDCLMSWEVLLMDTDFHNIYDEAGKLSNVDKPISIGNNVWIGCRSTILKGSSIPDGAVIAATSTISRKLQVNNCIYGGSRGGDRLKENVYWQR